MSEERARGWHESTDVEELRRAADAMALLADVSHALADARDLDASLAALAEHLVPQFTDLCAVYLVRDGVLIPHTVRHADPERRIARTFQETALPRALPRVDGLRLDVVYVPSERDAGIGGDWYDAFLLRDEKLVVSIGDVAGKGVDAAVLMSSLRQAVRVAAYQGLDPAAAVPGRGNHVRVELPVRRSAAR